MEMAEESTKVLKIKLKPWLIIHLISGFDIVRTKYDIWIILYACYYYGVD